jgi:multidrug efflux system outer membrane protein
MPAISPSLARPLAWAAPLLFAACTVGPRYQAPKPALPGSFSEAKGPPGSEPAPAALARWWTVFRDRELDALVSRAVAGNRDLQQALSRLRQARAERAMVTGGSLPDVDATAGYNRGRGSKTVVLPFGGGQGGGGAPQRGGAIPQAGGQVASASSGGGGGQVISAPAPSGAPPGGPQTPFGEGGLPGVTTNLYQLGFDATWEVDLFGGTRRALEAANAQVAAAEAGIDAVRVSLAAETAQAYFQLRLAQERAAVARRNLDAQEHSLAIARAKFRAGIGTEAPIAEQEAQVAAIRASLPQLGAEERLARHALEFIVGAQPGSLENELAPASGPPALPPLLPAGVPSDLLRRRPDIRVAERQLAAATAQVGEATAQLFPQFSLTGSLGLDTSLARQLIDRRSGYYSIAPGIRWPILDWGRIRAQIRVMDAAREQAFLSYQTAVAQALKDVEDALVHYEADLARASDLADELAAARRDEQIASQTYARGLADALAEIDAQRSVLQAEDQLAQAQGKLRLDLVALYKALGGGWPVPTAASWTSRR